MIVLLHGFTGLPRSFDTLLRDLDGPVLAPMLLGHGASAPGVSSFESEVDRLAGLIAAEGNEAPCSIVGYSLGGRLALGLAAQHPELCAAIVAIGAHPGLRDDAARAARLRADVALANRIERFGVDAFVSEWEALPLFASQTRLPAAVRAAQRKTRLACDPAGLSRSLRTVGLGRMPDLHAALRSSRVPLRLVTGGLDDKFGALAEELAPRAHRVVPGVGHNVLLEEPAAVAAQIHEMLRPSSPRLFEARS